MNQLYHYINHGVVDLYQDPDPMSPVVNQAIYGSPLQILQKKQSWTQIELLDLYQGWVKTECLISLSQKYPSLTSSSVSTCWTYIYYSPDTSTYPPAISIPYLTKIEVLSSESERTNRWMRVRLIDRRELYAQSADFNFSKHQITIKEMIQESMKFLGLPYRWGGNSGFGFDCSGFVQTLFSQRGILLPRDAKDQAYDSQLKTIEKKELQQGDLIFFGKEEKVNHVGICIGHPHFIHAVTTNEIGPHVIQISNIEDDEWRKRYYVAKRGESSAG